jgi:hypothetical protein
MQIEIIVSFSTEGAMRLFYLSSDVGMLRGGVCRGG